MLLPSLVAGHPSDTNSSGPKGGEGRGGEGRGGRGGEGKGRSIHLTLARYSSPYQRDHLNEFGKMPLGRSCSS